MHRFPAQFGRVKSFLHRRIAIPPQCAQPHEIKRIFAKRGFVQGTIRPRDAIRIPAPVYGAVQSAPAPVSAGTPQLSNGCKAAVAQTARTVGHDSPAGLEQAASTHSRLRRHGRQMAAHIALFGHAGVGVCRARATVALPWEAPAG